MDADRELDLDGWDLPPWDDGEPPRGGPPPRPHVRPVLRWLLLFLALVGLKQVALVTLPLLPAPWDARGTLALFALLLGGGFVLALLFARAHEADRRRGARR